MTDGAPTVTVGLPVRNGAATVGRALADLLRQDGVDLEVIVSDNASSDGTAEVIAEVAGDDERVRLLRQPSNIGMVGNFQGVLERAAGRYFVFAAADDGWEPTFLARLVDRLDRDPSVVVALSAVARFRPDGSEVDVVRNPQVERLGWFRLALNIALARSKENLYCYGLFRREFLERAFIVPDVVAGDRLLVMQFALAGRLAYVDDVLCHRVHSTVAHADRYGDESYGRLWRDRLRNWRYLATLPGYLWRSPVVPLRRKVAIPVLLVAAVAAHLRIEVSDLFGRARPLRRLPARIRGRVSRTSAG